MRGAARRKMIVAFILMLRAIVFFVLYSQMPTSLNFFAIRNVEHSIHRYRVRTGTVSGAEPIADRIGSPILAAIYNPGWAIRCRCRWYRWYGAVFARS